MDTPLEPNSAAPNDIDRHRFDPLTVRQIVRLALAEGETGGVLPMAQALKRKGLDSLASIVERLAASRYRQRRQVAAVLGRAFAGSALSQRAELVLAHLFDDRDLGVASMAVCSMGELGRFSDPIYIDRFRDHPDFLMRWAREQALGLCAWGFGTGTRGDLAAIRALAELSSQERDPTLAASAMFELATLAQYSERQSAEMEAALVAGTKSANKEVRRNAREGLRKLRREDDG